MSEKRHAAAKLSQLKDGDMRELTLAGTNVLLARVGDRCYAVGANCTHYGAPLVDGFLNGSRIVCPWHHACFDVRNGACEEPPAFDALPSYDVTIEDDSVFVTIPENTPDRRIPAMSKRDATDKRVFVILGGGAAGYMAAQTLREDGFTGRVVMITKEGHYPYDRPNLSKDYLHGHAEPEWIPLRSEEFFAQVDIEVIREKTAERIDPSAKTIRFTDGEILPYDSLLVATGATPRKLPFQTASQTNVYLLRSFDDADALIAAAEEGKRAVVIGSGFIGMEAASSLRQRGCEVTVVTPDDVPMAKVLGEEIGREFQNIHETQGVKFRFQNRVKGFIGSELVEAVELESGERLDTDFVLVGIGVTPVAKFLSGIEFHKDGGVLTDDHLQVTSDLYAAGDIAHVPDPRTGEKVRIEHWRTALQQGRTAAHNMAGKRTPFTAVPFFWTRQFDTTLNYVGHANSWDDIVIRGDVSKHDFVAFYIKDHRVLSAAGMNRDRELALFEELIRLNRVPTPGEVKEGSGDILNAAGRELGKAALALL